MFKSHKVAKIASNNTISQAYESHTLAMLLKYSPEWIRVSGNVVECSKQLRNKFVKYHVAI